MNKFENVTLGTQSGKTAQILAYLRSVQSASSDALNIIYTQNTLLNTQQFMARVVSSLPLNRGKIAIIASNFKGFGDAMRVDKSNFVFGKKICDVPLSEVSVLLQCKNSCRINSLISVVSSINDRQINVIIDEAHQAIDTTHKKCTQCKDKNSIATWGYGKKRTHCSGCREPEMIKQPPKISTRELIEKLCMLDNVSKVIGLTATPMKLFQAQPGSLGSDWSSIKHVLYTPTNLEGSYYKISDMNNINVEGFEYDADLHIDQDLDIASQYLTYILSAHPEILRPGARVFCPGMRLCDSHDSIEYTVFEFETDAVVVKLNGKNKTLSYIDDTDDMHSVWESNIVTINLLDNIEGTSEINEIIADVMETKGLSDRPLVITGYMCVSVGATLVNERLGNFTAGIFHPHIGNIKNRDNIYQIVGRTASRSLTWATHTSTTLYCDPNIYNIACGLEKAALAHSTLDVSNKIIDLDEYLKPFNDFLSNV